MLRILCMAEVVHSFSTYGAYVRTYHNILPDDVTREDWQSALDGLKAQGWEEVSVGEAWRHFMAELERQFEANLGAPTPFGAPEDDMRLARQLAANREQVEKRYRSKFANAAESQQWESVPLRRWYG